MQQKLILTSKQVEPMKSELLDFFYTIAKLITHRDKAIIMGKRTLQNQKLINYIFLNLIIKDLYFQI